jgi:hypothetical protein
MTKFNATFDDIIKSLKHPTANKPTDSDKPINYTYTKTTYTIPVEEITKITVNDIKNNLKTVPADGNVKEIPPKTPTSLYTPGYNPVRPKHYGGEENPFEPIKIIEHYDLNFYLGNVMKYVIRAGKKDPNTELEDLKKAQFYLNRHIEWLERQKNASSK